MRLNITPASTGSGSGYATIQDEGTPLTQRTTINFTGSGVTASDSGGITVVNIPGGSGTGATGSTTVDFGAFPGKSDTSVAITGQTSITGTSIVNAWLYPKATSDHSVDEHIVETIKVFAGNIVAGTGFTIYAVNTSQVNEPLELVKGKYLTTATGPLQAPQGNRSQYITAGGKGTRIYGQWTVAWKWE